MQQPRLPMTREEVLWARERAAEGYSAAQIARSLKRNPETVRRALRGDTHQEVEMPLGAGLRGPSVAELQPPAGRPQGDPAPMTRAEWESLERLRQMLGQAEGTEVAGKTAERLHGMGFDEKGRALDAAPPAPRGMLDEWGGE